MPYSSVNKVSEIPKTKRKQWMRVWKSAYKAAIQRGMDDGEAEEFAFKSASGAIKKANRDFLEKVQPFIKEELNKAFIEDNIDVFLLKSWEYLHRNPDKFPNVEKLKDSIRNQAHEHKVSLPEPYKLNFTKASVDSGLGIIYFIASRANIFDDENHIIELDDLKKAAFDFVLKSRKGDSNHNENQVSDIVESMVFDDKIIELIKAGKIQSGDWVVGMKPHSEELLNKAIKGEIRGASIGGKAIMEAIQDEQE